MELVKAETLAHRELRAWGLDADSWTFRFNPRTKRILGRCFYRKRMIELSTQYVELNEEAEVLDTIRHEVAHALAHKHDGEHGHGSAWKKWCLRTGANPLRLATDSVVIPKKKWQCCFVSNGKIERLNWYAYRRSDLSRRYMIGRKEETLGRLQWLPLD